MKKCLLIVGILFYGVLLSIEMAFSDALQNPDDFIILEDYTHQSEDGLPLGWKPQRDNPAPSEAYEIREIGGVLSLYAKGKPNRIFKKMKWNPYEYPFVTWKWRMLKVPDDPDKERNATVYIALGTDILGIPKLTKYAWSSNKAVGSEESGGIFRPTTIVIRSGPPKSDEWVTETINVLEEHRRLHGEDPPDEAYGFGIISTLEAEFGAFIAHKQASSPTFP